LLNKKGTKTGTTRLTDLATSVYLLQREVHMTYTYLLKNKQGNFETTKLTFNTRKQAQREAQIWAKNWVGLTGEYIVVQTNKIEQVKNVA
jgi:hypothetical protein